MKKITLILSFISLCNLLNAQKIYQKWFTVLENDMGEIEFIKDDKIIFQQYSDLKAKKTKGEEFQLKILKTVKTGKAIRFIVIDYKTNKIGLIHCFDINKKTMRMYLLQKAGTIEEAEKYILPHNQGIRCYSRDKTGELLKGKDLNTFTKEDAGQLFKVLKTQIEKLPNREDIQDRDYEMYLFNMFYDLLADNGYNIFVGAHYFKEQIERLKEDSELAKLIDEIEELIEGSKDEYIQRQDIPEEEDH